MTSPTDETAPDAAGGVPPGAALVTGAGRRIGRAIARDLGRAGWDVALHCMTSVEGAEETAAEIRALGRRAAVLRADLLDETDAAALVPRAAEALGGPLSLLVNNASIFEHDTLASATRESWDRHMGSNLRAPFVLTQAFAAQAPEAATDAEGFPRATACVVNMIDQRVWKPTPEFMTYSLAKAALWAFTRTAAQGLAPGIRVNGIGPGPTLQGDRQSRAHFDGQRRAVLLERGASTAEVCAALRWILASDSLTGQMLALDGGQHLGWRTPDVQGIE
ncbi:NAD(P)-dependent dehydrogenase, short-chain alcohol dehydrogenase family [Albimonas donghaensis]|uniref:NAD(P)-dependent dehydrogenase, short-chain alcohol dehydrogenase family n=1 Tax=Albimonas donghaensis TaxID=356660 RepID=A0A1H2WY62_9RHOB|nr:SDR family oxidoreductase [Albimonas donghaensis]SDW85515.1 NAD(P)-dependent dehydrogenase, short-chain alcohol dehydrogenase family [Albimonas donghaensis]